MKRGRREEQTLSNEHVNARKAYIYAVALLEGVGDFRSISSRIRLCAWIKFRNEVVDGEKDELEEERSGVVEYDADECEYEI